MTILVIFFLISFIPVFWVNYVFKKNDTILPNMPFNAHEFGDLTEAKAGVGGLSSATRGIFAGGYTPTVKKRIEKIEIATKGNATNFGDLTTVRRYCGGMSDCVRGVVAAGHNPSATNNIDFFNISTSGDGFDFGDQTTAAQTHGTSNGHGGL